MPSNIFPYIGRLWGAGHYFWEIRKGFRAKLYFVSKGTLPTISLCEARFSDPYPLLIIIAQSHIFCLIETKFGNEFIRLKVMFKQKLNPLRVYLHFLRDCNLFLKLQPFIFLNSIDSYVCRSFCNILDMIICDSFRYIF